MAAVVAENQVVLIQIGNDPNCICFLTEVCMSGAVEKA